MGRKEKCDPSDRAKNVIRHINKENPDFTATQCAFHFDKPCFILLNNFNHERFHCLFAKDSNVWRSYSITKSCDIPEHFYDLIQLRNSLGDEYVLKFAGHLRESSGYCVGMFRQPIDSYPPSKLSREFFKETAYATIVFLCSVCHRLGGSTPNIKLFGFLFTPRHPILTDIGSNNSDIRERVSNRIEHFNEKKWKRFMQRKTTRDVIRYLKLIFPNFFQKRKNGCMLSENGGEEVFDDETHNLICKSVTKSLVQVLFDFQNLMPDEHIRNNIIGRWIKDVMLQN